MVAEHALVRAGLRAVLDTTPGLSVADEAADVDAATSIAARVQPRVILLDPAAGISGEDLRALRRAVPSACLVCLSRSVPEGDDELRCIPPESDVAAFCSALSSMLGDQCSVCVLQSHCPAPRIAVALSRRERQVAVRVASGMSSKQIAAALGIRLRTVNTYRESLARKLGASSPAIVTRYVLEQGLSSLAAD